MAYQRAVEFLFTLILACFVIFSISFFSLKPVLLDGREITATQWDAFVRAMADRNGMLPGLAEALRSFEPRYIKVSQALLDARAVSLRISGPQKIIKAANDLDRALDLVEKETKTNGTLLDYGPFSSQWKSVQRESRRVYYARKSYNTSARMYNLLLRPFPQNLLTSAFGYTPLPAYDEGVFRGD